MHDSVANISSDKRLGDKMQRQIELITMDKESLSAQVKEMRDQISRVIQERDSFRADLRDIHKSKKQIEQKYEYDKKTSKEREAKLQKQLAQVNKDNNDH